MKISAMTRLAIWLFVALAAAGPAASGLPLIDAVKAGDRDAIRAIPRMLARAGLGLASVETPTRS